MTKKDDGRTYHKPKPRLAVYAGLIGSGATALGAVPSPNWNKNNVLDFVRGGSSVGGIVKAAGFNVGQITSDPSAAVAVAAPAILGIVVSVGADKLGVNKVLAKMKAPFRV